jgi:RNA recognition motif-containing protein
MPKLGISVPVGCWQESLLSALVMQFRPVRSMFLGINAERKTTMKIYVGNLSYTATEDDIRQAFEEYGNLSSVDIITDRETGRSRGFAFVEMPDGGEAKQAIEKLNLAEIAGRKVTVNEARPKTDRGGGGGRRGGGGGGGRGRW